MVNKVAFEMIYKDLKDKYKKLTISQKELAKELGISDSSLASNIKAGINIPKYRVIGMGEIRQKKVFPLIEVAKFLSDTERVF
ncbi:helix-turn-helix domain-containing protein [Campylobacter ureolyticus]|uniref:HTH cro/C1-type domain-containing protein n=1 Tax=Campylobacter ureolyticus TaxID=827 RepID=A0A6N2RSS2_9BACT